MRLYTEMRPNVSRILIDKKKKNSYFINNIFHNKKSSVSKETLRSKKLRLEVLLVQRFVTDFGYIETRKGNTHLNKKDGESMNTAIKKTVNKYVQENDLDTVVKNIEVLKLKVRKDLAELKKAMKLRKVIIEKDVEISNKDTNGINLDSKYSIKSTNESYNNNNKNTGEKSKVSIGENRRPKPKSTSSIGDQNSDLPLKLSWELVSVISEAVGAQKELEQKEIVKKRRKTFCDGLREQVDKNNARKKKILEDKKREKENIDANYALYAQELKEKEKLKHISTKRSLVCHRNELKEKEAKKEIEKRLILEGELRFLESLKDKKKDSKDQERKIDKGSQPRSECNVSHIGIQEGRQERLRREEASRILKTNEKMIIEKRENHLQTLMKEQREYQRKLVEEREEKRRADEEKRKKKLARILHTRSILQKQIEERIPLEEMALHEQKLNLSLLKRVENDPNIRNYVKSKTMFIK